MTLKRVDTPSLRTTAFNLFKFRFHLYVFSEQFLWKLFDHLISLLKDAILEECIFFYFLLVHLIIIICSFVIHEWNLSDTENCCHLTLVFYARAVAIWQFLPGLRTSELERQISVGKNCVFHTFFSPKSTIVFGINT